MPFADLLRLVLVRALQGAVLLVVLSFLLFGMMSKLPGDPVDLLVASNPELRSEDIIRLKKLRGLDQPFPVRWWRWFVGYHEARLPPPTRTLPAVVGEQDIVTDFGTPRPFAVDVEIDQGALTRLGLTATAAHPASYENGHLKALVSAGATRLAVIVTDAYGQQAPWIVPVYVATPISPGADKGDVVVLDGDPSALLSAGSTEGRAQRSEAQLIAAATAIRPLPEPPPIVDIPRLRGQTVAAEDGDVYIARGTPIEDPDVFVCGVLCVVVGGDLDSLGFSHASKRPVRELLFGTRPVCGDGNVDAGEACDDGPDRPRPPSEPDTCSATCTPTDRPFTVVDKAALWCTGQLIHMGRIGNTLVLTMPALALAMLLSLLAGTWAGWRGGVVDVVVRVGAAITSSVPAFFVALLLVTLFAEQWRVLPSGGVFSAGIQDEGLGAVVVDRVRHALMPITVLVLFWSGRFVRQVRSAVKTAASGDYVRTARMKGASTWQIVRRHVLPNAAVPLVTLVGLSLPSMFGGALLTETVFAWPGLGRLQYDAILQNDSYVAVVVFLGSAALVLAGSLFADIAVFILDPRTRRSS